MKGQIGMTTHHYQPTHYHVTIGSHEPVLHIAGGDTVITSTVDAGGHDASGERVTEGGNPQTGPFYVDGAEPGDTLVLHLDRLIPNRDTGYSGTVLAANVVDPDSVRELPERSTGEWEISPDGASARLVSPQTALGSLTLPTAPMLGCFGVAPYRDQAISTATFAE